MKKITKYIAFDNSEFSNELKCVEYETESYKVLDIINRLGSKPESCDFSNGCGYIQHKKETFLSVRNDLLELAKFYIDHKWIQESIDRQTVHSSHAHRLIGELSNISLNKAWYRIHCTDSRYREWGQPYYADHPESGTQQEIKG